MISLRRSLSRVARVAMRPLTWPGILYSPFIRKYPPGHFYSPIPDLGYLQANEASIFATAERPCPGVDLRDQVQFDHLDKFQAYYADLPFRDEPQARLRYYYANSYFSYSDAIILYSMLRHFQPKKVIEVGSGFSSAVMLDTNDVFLGGGTTFTFIEPYPDRLLGLLREADRRNCRLLQTVVQKVDIAEFQHLAAGDFLFVDSSHVVKAGSDVAMIVFDVLPRLNPGVVIHFHDVLWPFEYPKSWFLAGRAWNEAYFLRAFLQYNSEFEILYFNSYMGTVHRARVGERLPLCLKNVGGGIWLRRKA